MEQLIAKSDERLMTLEGYAFEKMVAVLYEERSRKGIGDFFLSRRIAGYWDRSDVEIDLVAVDEPKRCIRFGNCKRSADRLASSLPGFEKHVGRFLEMTGGWQDWRIEKACLAPIVDAPLRKDLSGQGYIVQDLEYLSAGLI